MNRRAFLSMMGLAAPTYFLAPRGGWIQPVPVIQSYADYINISDLPLFTTVFYDERFVENLKDRSVWLLMQQGQQLPLVNAGNSLIKMQQGGINHEPT